MANEHTAQDIWTFWICNAIAVPEILFAVFATVYVWNRTKHRWVREMFVWCIFQNIATEGVSIGEYYEESRLAVT